MQRRKKPGTYTATTPQGLFMEMAADKLAEAATSLGKLAEELMEEKPAIKKATQGIRKVIGNLDVTADFLEKHSG